MGTNFCLTHIIIFGLIIKIILQYTIKRAVKQQTEDSKKINKYIFFAYRPYFKLKHWLTWVFVIRLSLEFYIETILCGLIIVTTMPWSDNVNNQTNCFYGTAYFVSAIVFPLVMFFFFKKNKDHLYETTFKLNYGGGYSGMKAPMSQDSELKYRRRSSVISIAMPLIFITRRIIFAFSVVLISGEGATGLLPILYCFWTNWFALEFLVTAQPYEKKKDTYMDIFNEVTLLILMCFILGFTAWMPNTDIEDSLI